MKHRSSGFSTPYDWPRPVCANEDSELWPINAMRDAGVDLEVIDTQRMMVVFANGIALPIIALYDASGLRVEDWEEARTFDFGNACIGYGTANARQGHAAFLN